MHEQMKLSILACSVYCENENVFHAIPGWSSQCMPKASITWKLYEVLTSFPVPPPLLHHV